MVMTGSAAYAECIAPIDAGNSKATKPFEKTLKQCCGIVMPNSALMDIERF
jgi:hypothetical protein